jgi:hypothetical protein
MKFKLPVSGILLRISQNIFSQSCMQNKITLASLAMDLKRVALGLHRKSYTMADRFFIEVMKRKDEVDIGELQPYMQTIIKRIGLLSDLDNEHRAEDALMYSTRIQNYVLYK